MKLATCIVLLCACLVHQASAQQNWWEIAEDGSTTISSSRGPTATPTATSTQAPAATTNCPCAVTPEYNPVCGDNKVTYTNPGMLACAQNCGLRVQLLFHGRCEKLS